MMWSWGGQEVEADGKKVAINSKATLDSVKFATAFWKDACDEGGLAWDDTNNNRAFLSGTIAATLNGASIYVESLRNKDKYKTDKGALMHTDIQHSPLPAGPAAASPTTRRSTTPSWATRRTRSSPRTSSGGSTPRSSSSPGSRSQRGFSVGPTTDWEKHKMWEQDPVMLPYRTAARTFRLFGYAGPPNAKASEAQTEVHHHRHVRQGDPGHGGRRSGQVGRG